MCSLDDNTLVYLKSLPTTALHELLDGAIKAKAEKNAQAELLDGAIKAKAEKNAQAAEKEETVAEPYVTAAFKLAGKEPDSNPTVGLVSVAPALGYGTSGWCAYGRVAVGCWNSQRLDFRLWCEHKPASPLSLHRPLL